MSPCRCRRRAVPCPARRRTASRWAWNTATCILRAANSCIAVDAHYQSMILSSISETAIPVPGYTMLDGRLSYTRSHWLGYRLRQQHHQYARHQRHYRPEFWGNRYQEVISRPRTFGVSSAIRSKSTESPAPMNAAAESRRCLVLVPRPRGGACPIAACWPGLAARGWARSRLWARRARRLNVAGVLLCAHSMVLAAYLIHEAAHQTLFAGRTANRLRGEAMNFIAGSSYASFERIRHMHIRHHVDRADLDLLRFQGLDAPARRCSSSAAMSRVAAMYRPPNC